MTKFDKIDDYKGYICQEHGIPAHVCMRSKEPHGINGWCDRHNLPLVVCPFHSCPACGEDKQPLNFTSADCPHTFHTADDSHQYGNMIAREGTGADAGGESDPLVQEPTE
jgi:hypothetical protein